MGQSEAGVHAAATRMGLNMEASVTYLDLPMCTNESDGTIEMVPWPFLLPMTLDSGFKFTLYYFMSGFSFLAYKVWVFH